MLAHLAARREDLDLADVRVAAVLVVGEDGDLDEVGRAHRRADRVGRALGVGRRQDRHPAARLVELLHVDLLEVVEGGAGADRDLRRRVALVELEVGVDPDLVQPHLRVELDVDEVRLRPSLCQYVSELSSRSWSTPLPGLAVESDHTAWSPTSRCSSRGGSGIARTVRLCFCSAVATRASCSCVFSVEPAHGVARRTVRLEPQKFARAGMGWWLAV